MKRLTMLATLMLAVLTTADAQWWVFSAADSVARPDTVTTYTLGDIVNDSTTSPRKVLVFSLKAPNGQPAKTAAFGFVQSLRAISDSAAVRSFIVHLYEDSTGIQRLGDNEPNVVSPWNFSRRIGSLVVSTYNSVAASAGYGITTGAGIPFSLPTGSRNIYGVIEAAAVWTPKAGERYRFELGGYYQ